MRWAAFCWERCICLGAKTPHPDKAQMCPVLQLTTLLGSGSVITVDPQSPPRGVARKVHKRMSHFTGKTLAAPEGTPWWLGCPLHQQGIENPASAGREPPPWTGRSLLPLRCHRGAVKACQTQSHHCPPVQGSLRRGPSSPDLTVPPGWETQLGSPRWPQGISTCWDAPLRSTRLFPPHSGLSSNVPPQRIPALPTASPT